MMTRRRLIAGLSALPLAPAFAADPLFATLDAVGPLEAPEFNPARALDAMHALMALKPAGAASAMRQYLASRRDPPGGLFVVLRCLIEVPAPDAPASAWPGVIQPGYLRPPALGGPHPPQPEDLTTIPRFPAMLLNDVPLSVVMGYILGGRPEPLSMHLDALAGATWRTAPLQPKSAGELRYMLTHWGKWMPGTPIGDALWVQLDRLKTG